MTIAEHYQQLPSLETARGRLLKNGGEALVEDVFRPFFQEHKMERRFGLQIAHRHFDVEQDEKVVHYGSCAVPWKASEGMPEPQPTVWAFMGGCARPVEFRHTTSEMTELGPPESRFMDAFSRLQEHQGTPGLFALCEYPGDDFEGSCEITQGRCNINLRPRDVSIALIDKGTRITDSKSQFPDNLTAVNTTWFFEENLWKRGCRCTCNASSSGHPHGVHVITRQG